MDAAYKTWGCPAAVACASLIAELAPGRSPKVLLSLTPADIDRLAGGLPEGRAHCPALTMEAVKQALDTAQSGE
jgi:nitrogen fixation NifU-like protein